VATVNFGGERRNQENRVLGWLVYVAVVPLRGGPPALVGRRCPFAFAELRLPRLVNGTGDDNIRSINLHRSLGFKIFRALPNNEGIVAVLKNNLV
jgi:RimJ/RimL family protein N-acetyltransferase